MIRNAVDDGEMMKQDEAPKNGEDIKKELTSAADITDDPEDMGEEGRDDGSFVKDDREHFFQGEGFEDTKEMKEEDIGGTRDKGSNVKVQASSEVAEQNTTARREIPGDKLSQSKLNKLN